MQIARRLVHALLIVLTLIVGAAAAAMIVSQTAWFKNWLRGYIVQEANRYLNGTLSIERLGGNLFFGVEMENIGVSLDGNEVVAVKDLGLRYSVFELLTKGVSVDEIRIDHPVIYLRREGDAWSLSRLVKKEQNEADRSGPGRPVKLSNIGISGGSVVIDGPVGTSGVAVPTRFEHVDAKFAFAYEPVRYSIEITHVSFRGSDPAIALNTLSGGVSVRDDTVFVDKLALRTEESSISIDGQVRQYLTTPALNLQITSDKLSLFEIGRLVPALTNVRLQPAFELKLNGPLDQLGIDMNVRSSAGRMAGRVTAGLLAPHQSVAGNLSVRHVDLSPILDDPRQKSDIDADARVDVRGEPFSNLDSVRGSLSIHAPRILAAGYAAGPVEAKAQIEGRRVAVEARAAAYGATATASGRVMLPDLAEGGAAKPVGFDLRGEARAIDLRRLPRNLKVPPAETNVNADYSVAGTIVTGPRPSQHVTAGARFRPSTIAGARIEEGSTVKITAVNPSRTPNAEGASHTPDANRRTNAFDISYGADLTVSGLDLQRVGREFGVPALATDRYKSTLNGHIAANGRGTSPAAMEVAARGELTDSSVLGGQLPQVSFDGALTNDTAHAAVAGAFTGFNPAVVSGRPNLDGTVGGKIDADVTAAHVSTGVTLDSVQATARIDLDPSNVGGLAITRASVDGDYRDSTGDIRVFEIVGRDVNVRANGTLALNDTGRSSLKVHADSPSLDALGKLADIPLTGIAKVDATVTGNRTNLQATGNLTGDGVKYGANGALTASSDFTVRVPDLDAQRASASLHTNAAFVSVGGQNINELTAKTDYVDKQVDFDMTARQPERSLSAAGSVILHPDHQEVHLRTLSLASQGVHWQTASGVQPTVNYANNAVTVEDFRLVNGAQEISADGSFGKPGDELKITLHDIDVATVDALLLRPPQLAGRLNATSTVRGSKDDPQVEGEFAIERGGFRQFKYDEFRGTARYADKGVTIDARVQQNPTTWLTARGYAPLSRDARRTEYDVHLDSSAIDLGVVQGFTTALTNVSGTLQAKIDVAGTVDDPQPSGVVSVEKAAFTVQPTGVSYSGLDGRIDLQPDRVHIDEIRVVDNHRSPMTVSGDLALHEREVAGVSIALQAKDFKVVDNKMGNMRIDSDLRLTGELAAPRLEGSLGITTGQLDLDAILAQVGESAYATKPTEFASSAVDSQGQTGTPGAFEALQMDVHFTVPNDLVVKANDLRAPGSPVGFGALNVTLGGDVLVNKAPWDQPRVYGVVNTVRGTYDFQGRRFTILRDGTVRFEGTDDLDPSLDLRTERVIQAVTARVDVRGTLKEPEIVLSSVPPLEQADILALIVFNQPASQLGEGQQISLAQRAQSLAVGAAAGELAQSIGRALNLDTFEINTAPETGGGPEVTVGQQVGQNLYVKVEQGIGDQSQTNFVLEYELTKWLRFRTNVLQGSSTQAQLFQRMQGSGVDLLFFFSY